MRETNGKNAGRQETALLFLHALTSLHPGSGTALGVVDLPIMRERHTQWPVIPGSAIKGVLRDACRQGSGNGDELFEAFGPESNDADKHAGAISLTDCRILAFPVRSLCGVFAWTTCPAVLDRLARDVTLAGMEAPRNPVQLKSDQMACPDRSPLLVDGRLVLEEFEFERAGQCDEVATWVAERAVRDPATRNRILTSLVILSDDDFTHFVRHGTEIMARIALDYDRKTVKGGALFYQECLPPETLFYSVVFANRSRKSNVKSAKDIMSFVKNYTRPVLQIGGDETTGKGLCHVTFANGKAGAQ